MHAIVNLAIRAARKAGQYIMSERDRLQYQFNATHLAKLEDEARRMMAEIVLAGNQQHGVIGFNYASEEAAKASDVVWQIEFTGTQNLLRRIPHIAIVITITEKTKLKHALTIDPYTDEIFSATAGGGAQCNDYRLRMSAKKSLEGCIITDTRLEEGTGVTYPVSVNLYQQGVPALAMAYLAADRIDGFVGQKLSQIELLAGSLFILEAGGLVGDFTGGHDYLVKGELVAAHPKLFKTLLQAVNTKD